MSVTLLVLSSPPSGSPHLSPALLWCTVGLISAGSGFLPRHLPPGWVRSVGGTEEAGRGKEGTETPWAALQVWQDVMWGPSFWWTKPLSPQYFGGCLWVLGSGILPGP